EAETFAAVLLAHITKPMPPARELAGELAGHVEEALRRGLAKTLAARDATAVEFMAALTPAAWPNRGGPAPSHLRMVHRPKEQAAPTPSVLVVDDSLANR